jgi:predicted metal-dependent hydrolase
MQPSLPFEGPAPESCPPNRGLADAALANPALTNRELENSETHIPNPVLVFTRHPKARRYIIRVADDGTVRVTVPRWGSKREAREFVESERAWIARERRRLERQRTTSDGASERTSADERLLRDRARRELPARLLELAARHGLAVARISIHNQRWRWGSCNRSGHICLNWRLVTMPESVRDYVLIHELMHLKRMDHSPRFWKLVAAACPGFQEARRWLRQQPRA